MTTDAFRGTAPGADEPLAELQHESTTRHDATRDGLRRGATFAPNPAGVSVNALAHAPWPGTT